MCKINALIFYIFIISKIYAFIAVKDFYPFGLENGDSTTANGIGRVKISTLLPFFDRVYSNIYVFVYQQGLITLKNLANDFGSCYNNQKIDVPSIYPFRTTDAIYQNNNLFYRETRDPEILSRAKSEISKIYPNLKTLYWAFVATWNNSMLYYSHQPDQFYSTFQVILATDGTETFSIFYYSNQSFSEVRKHSLPILIGIDAGNQKNKVVFEASCTLNAYKVNEGTNVGSPGKYIFALTNSTTVATPLSPGPTTLSSISTSSPFLNSSISATTSGSDFPSSISTSNSSFSASIIASEASVNPLLTTTNSLTSISSQLPSSLNSSSPTFFTPLATSSYSSLQPTATTSRTSSPLQLSYFAIILCFALKIANKLFLF